MRIGLFAADARQMAVFDAFAARSLNPEWIGSEFDAQAYDFTVLPMPVSTDGKTLYENDRNLNTLLQKLSGSLAFGGRISREVEALAQQNHVRLVDYFQREEMTVRNVIPTVEGALQIAMEQTDFTLHGSHVLVCGYGRIGKLLALRLQSLGAVVSVSARKARDLAWCEALGFIPVSMNALRGALPKQQIIFSTVPALIFDREQLAGVSPAALMIDLASAPGSIDYEKATAFGLHAVSALALPGKVAPKTAGEIIAKTILEIYKEDTYGG